MSGTASAERDDPLPLHGFVLAGGKSSRMGRDKALLPFRGQPMIGLAVGKLRAICVATSIVGNRQDLATFAPVVREDRGETGPGAGLEAGLAACSQPWAMFLPVDVPLVPAGLLRRWAREVLGRAENGCSASFLLVNGARHPAICMLPRGAQSEVTRALEGGERRMERLLYAGELAGHGRVWPAEAAELPPAGAAAAAWLDLCFSNVNTPAELEEAERRAEACEAAPGALPLSGLP